MDRMTCNVTEAAEALGLSRNLVYGLVREGKLPSIRLGEKRIVIPVKALESFINSCAQASVNDVAS